MVNLVNDSVGFSLRDGLDLVGMGVSELWTRYLGLGGRADEVGFAAMLSTGGKVSAHEYDVVAQALNEAFLDNGCSSFPVGYSHRPACSAAAPLGRSAPVDVSAPRFAARQAAELARLRSAAAARRSAHLHAVAADLMRSSGQLQFARRAGTRSRAAQQRAIGLG